MSDHGHTRPTASVVAGAEPVAAVAICSIVDRALDVDAHRDAVAMSAGGAEVVFCGVVRDHDGGRDVTSLEYQGHPDAENVMRAIANDVAGRAGVLSVAVSHRVGVLAVGDVALVAAVSSAHRAEAFARCAELVEEVKSRLPIWKRQVFSDGSAEWVNCP